MLEEGEGASKGAISALIGSKRPGSCWEERKRIMFPQEDLHFPKGKSINFYPSGHPDIRLLAPSLVETRYHPDLRNGSIEATGLKMTLLHFREIPKSKYLSIRHTIKSYKTVNIRP